MSEEIETIEAETVKVCPWKDGYWVYKIEGTQYIQEVKGNDAVIRNLAQMDYPDIPDSDMNKGTWSYGDFGEAPEALRVRHLFDYRNHILC